MERLLAIGISNALAAGALALVALAVGRLLRRPAVTHALWLLVLVKLLTPPFVVVPIFPAVEEEPPSAAPALGSEYGVPPSEPLRADYDAFVSPAEPLVPLEESPGLVEPFLLERIDDSKWRLETRAPALELTEDALAAQSMRFEGASAHVQAAPRPVRASSRRFDDVTWMRIAWALWCGGSLLWCAVALVRIARFGRVLRYSKPASEAIQQTAREMSARLGLRRCPAIEVLPGRLPPLVWFVGRRPRLFVSGGLLERLDAQQTAGLVAHELAHLLRRDHWVRLVELTATVLYWWNPVLWWARRELREAEEQCCDAWAVWALHGSPRAYAETLLETVDLLSQTPLALPPLASGLADERMLRRRLTMIMQKNPSRRLSRAACCALLALAAALLPLVPGRAQSGAAPQEDHAQSQDSAASSIDREDASRTAQEADSGAAEQTDSTGAASVEQNTPPSPEILAALAQLRKLEEAAQYTENLYRRGFATKAQLEADQLGVEGAKQQLQVLRRRAHEGAKADLIQAQNDLELAKISHREAVEGTFPQEEQVLQANVLIAEENLARARNKLENVKRLHEKGFASKQEVEAAKFAVERAQLELENAKTALKVTLEFTHPKILKELEAQIERAEADLRIVLLNLRQLEAVLDAVKRVPQETGRSADAPDVSGRLARPSDTLAKERVDAARQAYEVSLELFRQDLIELDLLYRWSVRWLNAERLAAGTNAEQRAALERHLARMQFLEDVATARREGGLRGGSSLDFVATKYYRLEAQTWVMDQGAGNGPDGVHNRQSPSQESVEPRR